MNLRGGRPASVSNILSGSGAGGVNLWGGDLGFVGGNFQEVGGGTRGFPHTVYRPDVQAAEGRDPETWGSVKCNQGSGNTDTGDIHLQAAGNSGVVGGVEADI